MTDKELMLHRLSCTPKVLYAAYIDVIGDLVDGLSRIDDIIDFFHIESTFLCGNNGIFSMNRP